MQVKKGPVLIVYMSVPLCIMCVFAYIVFSRNQVQAARTDYSSYHNLIKKAADAEGEAATEIATKQVVSLFRLIRSLVRQPDRNGRKHILKKCTR